jgi:hypothetical protein
MIHESGTAQLEINFNHGDPVRLADQVLVFKRIVRQVALKHGVYATFMAKPMEHQPGSAMHLHISLVDEATGENLFADADGSDSAMFAISSAACRPTCRRSRRCSRPTSIPSAGCGPAFSAPINVQWGYDNRSCGLRVPISDRAEPADREPPAGRRRQPLSGHRASLVCGYLGIEGDRADAPMVTGNAYHQPRTLPRTLEEALERFSACSRCAICWASPSSAPSPASRRPSWTPSRRDQLVGARPPAAQGLTPWASTTAGMAGSYYAATANPFEPGPRCRRGRGRSGAWSAAAAPACRRRCTRASAAVGRAAGGRPDRLGRVGPQWRPDDPGPAQIGAGAGRALWQGAGEGAVHLSVEAMDLVVGLIQKHGIDCDLR